jgi:hypothetical protein
MDVNKDAFHGVLDILQAKPTYVLSFLHLSDKIDLVGKEYRKNGEDGVRKLSDRDMLDGFCGP